MLTLTKNQKEELIGIVKKIDIGEAVINGDDNKKWFKFGAYDTLNIVSEVIKAIPEEEKETKKIPNLSGLK